MAHQVETMAYAGEVPWHGLGVKVIDDLTPDQMLKKAGLDWTVSTRPMYFKNTNKPEYTEIPKRRVLVRDSDETILSTVGDGWKPLQNSEDEVQDETIQNCLQALQEMLGQTDAAEIDLQTSFKALASDPDSQKKLKFLKYISGFSEEQSSTINTLQYLFFFDN